MASRSQVEAIIREEFASAGLDPNLGVAIGKHESGLDPDAVNMTGGDLRRGGSFGPMQMSLATARDLGFSGTPQQLQDPRQNARLAAALVKNLSGRFEDTQDVISAYNSGRPLSRAPASTREQYVPGVLSHMEEAPASSAYSPPADAGAEDAWAAPPTEQEMRTGPDPWAAPPTPNELSPRVQKPKPTGPSPGVPNVLDLLQRGMEWAGQKNAEATKDSPNLALFTRMMGMGAMGASPAVSPRMMLMRKAQQAEPPAAESVLSQIQPAGGAMKSPLPEMPGIVDTLAPKWVSKTYDILRKATERPVQTPNPYPAEAWSATPPPLKAGQGAPPQAMPAEAPPPTPQPPAPPPPPALVAPPPTPTPVANIFEKAARGRKVSELVKAIDANASAHLGVDPMDPRFGEALGSLPQEWWEGMGSVAKINKPSPDTIADVLAFYKDRAGQSAQKITP